MMKIAKPRVLEVQFKGSRGDWLAIGSLSTRPSEVMRKTLPERSEDVRLDLTGSMALDED